MRDRLISLEWVKDLGPERHSLPEGEVLQSLKNLTGYDISYLFEEYTDAEIEAKLTKQVVHGFSFFRNIEELKVVMEYSYLLQTPLEFAPFGVSYGLSKKREKKKFVDWPINTYGVCFSGQHQDKNKILVWDGERDYVNDWPSFKEFIG